MTMTFEQMQAILSQITQANVGLHERQNRTETLIEETNKALSRIEAIAEENSKWLTETKTLIDSNARAIEATNNSLNAKFEQIANAVINGQDRLERLERRDKRIDKEIRGLRIETRRMLERWLGEPFTDNPDLDDEDES